MRRMRPALELKVTMMKMVYQKSEMLTMMMMSVKMKRMRIQKSILVLLSELVRN